MNRNTYKVWHAMHKRCTDPKYSNYPNYGGRGITVCERWATFTAFLEDMGEKPDGTLIDRIDNEKGYSPDNCRWVTPAESIRNRRITDFHTYQGKTLCLTDWAREFGMSKQKLAKRLALGWSFAEAATLSHYGRKAA